ncbi:MAG TPA: STAS domain-containing protein [Ilumatobacteraceae bacterium]|jgi:rsbT co-antagonist protein RsbR
MPRDWNPKFVSALDDHAAEVVVNWEADLKARQRSSRSTADAQELTSLLDTIIAGVRSGDNARGAGFAETRALLAEMSIVRARQGFTPTETAAAVFALKPAIAPVVPPDQLAELVELSLLIDDLGLFTFETFAAARESVILSQTEQLLELSTPVVKLWDGVLAVPLVGTLDSARTQVVMETLLQTLVDTGSAHAIIDITGVAAVDTQVAQHLLKTVVAARLMGAECIISGIRPQIAQTVVALGIEFGDIPTKATLADALRHVLSQAGYDIVRRSSKSA